MLVTYMVKKNKILYKYLYKEQIYNKCNNPPDIYDEKYIRNIKIVHISIIYKYSEISAIKSVLPYITEVMYKVHGTVIHYIQLPV